LNAQPGQPAARRGVFVLHFCAPFVLVRHGSSRIVRREGEDFASGVWDDRSSGGSSGMGGGVKAGLNARPAGCNYPLAAARPAWRPSRRWFRSPSESRPRAANAAAGRAQVRAVFPCPCRGRSAPRASPAPGFLPKRLHYLARLARLKGVQIQCAGEGVLVHGATGCFPSILRT